MHRTTLHTHSKLDPFLSGSKMFESLMENRSYDHYNTLCPQIALYDFAVLEEVMKLHRFYTYHAARDKV